MELNDTFTFGQYKGLTLKEVYQGTDKIDKSFLSKYLSHCLKSKSVPRATFFEFCELLVSENEIIVLPQIFNEEKPLIDNNVVCIGNISGEIENYFNNFFNKNMYGTIDSLEHFNDGQIKQILGGDPEYIQWCLSTVDNFEISDYTKDALEKLPVNRFLGISVSHASTDKYSYKLKTVTEYYEF